MNIQGRNGMAIEINFLAMQFLELYNINEHVMEEEKAGECGEEWGCRSEPIERFNLNWIWVSQFVKPHFPARAFYFNMPQLLIPLESTSIQI